MIQADILLPKSGRPAPKVRRPLILCIDDNELILELLREGLTASGFDVICELHPERAVKMIQAFDLDAVVLDYEMPECNGLDLSKDIQRCKPSVPVLMFSGALLPQGSLPGISSFVPKNQGLMALVVALERDLCLAGPCTTTTVNGR